MSLLPTFLFPDDPLYLSSDEDEWIDHVSDSEEEELQQRWNPPTGYIITKEDWNGGMEVMDTITDLVYAQDGDSWILNTNIQGLLTNPKFDDLTDFAMKMLDNSHIKIEDLPPAGYAFFANKVVDAFDTEPPIWYLLNVNDSEYWKIFKDEYGYYYQNMAKPDEVRRELPVVVEDTDTKIYNHLKIQQEIKDLLVVNSDEDSEKIPSLLIDKDKGAAYVDLKLKEILEEILNETDPVVLSTKLSDWQKLAETLTVDPPDNDFKIDKKQAKRNEDGRRVFDLMPRNVQKEWLKRHGVVDISTYDFSDNSDSDDSDYDPDASDDSSSDEDSDDDEGSSSLFSVGEFVTFKDGWDVGLTDPADVNNSRFVQSMGSENWEIMEIDDYVNPNPYLVNETKYEYQLKKQFVGNLDTIEDQILHYVPEEFLEKTGNDSIKQHQSDITAAKQRRNAILAQESAQRKQIKAQERALEQAKKQASAFASLLAAPGISSLAMTGTMPSTSITDMRV